MAQYKSTDANAATISIASATNVVNGTNTQFASRVKAGDWLVVGTDNFIMTVQSVTNDTTLLLTANYASTVADEDFVFHIDFTPNGLPTFNQGDIRQHVLMTRAMVLADALISGMDAGDDGKTYLDRTNDHYFESIDANTVALYVGGTKVAEWSNI